MQDETRRSLLLFVEKANRLLSLSFSKSVLENNGVNFNIAWSVGEELRVERNSPDDEAIDAFVLTLRFFIQDNEDSSFRSINNLAMSDPGVSNEWKQEFTNTRNELNRYLDSPPKINYVENGQSIASNKQILDVFVYGGLAHANPLKRATFEKWRMDDMVFQLLQFQFAGILQNILRAASYIAQLSERELN